MSNSRNRFWTRKDVARALEISVDAVMHNEERLGLDKARRDLNSRVIRYRCSIAIRALERLKAELAPYPTGYPMPTLRQINYAKPFQRPG